MHQRIANNNSKWIHFDKSTSIFSPQIPHLQFVIEAIFCVCLHLQLVAGLLLFDVSFCVYPSLCECEMNLCDENIYSLKIKMEYFCRKPNEIVEFSWNIKNLHSISAILINNFEMVSLD